MCSMHPNLCLLKAGGVPGLSGHRLSQLNSAGKCDTENCCQISCAVTGECVNKIRKVMILLSQNVVTPAIASVLDMLLDLVSLKCSRLDIDLVNCFSVNHSDQFLYRIHPTTVWMCVLSGDSHNSTSAVGPVTEHSTSIPPLKFGCVTILVSTTALAVIPMSSP